MIILKILGWIGVIFLFGSFLYSMKFHLGNYFIQRKRIKNGEIGEVYKQLHKEFGWGKIVFIQLIKLFLTVLLLTVLIDSQGNKVSAGWTNTAKLRMLEGCKSNKPIKGMTENETEEYCNCILKKMMEAFPNPDKVKGDLPESFIKKAGLECLEELGFKEFIVKNYLENDKESFISSLDIFKNAFDLEPYVTTKEQQKEYLELIKNGFEKGDKVSNIFLDSLHKELKIMFKEKLIKGAKLIYEGNIEEDNISKSLNKMRNGSSLVNEFSNWWNDHRDEINWHNAHK